MGGRTQGRRLEALAAGQPLQKGGAGNAGVCVRLTVNETVANVVLTATTSWVYEMSWA